TFTFDGAYAGQYGVTRAMLDAVGWDASMMQMFSSADDQPFYVPGPAGGTGAAYMALSELSALDASGWDMSTHSGVLLSGRSEAFLHRLARSRIAWLQARGYDANTGGRFLCGLQSQWDNTAVNVLRQYFWLLRSGSAYTQASSPWGQPSLPVINPSGVIDASSANAAPYADTALKIDRAALHKQWTILT